MIAHDNDVVLEVSGLETFFETRVGTVKAVNGASFTLKRGQVLGLVGESGSGKSITGYSILGAIDAPGRVVGGSISFWSKDGTQHDLVKASEKSLRTLRGNKIAMIMQDPMMSLNPSLRIGTQLCETYLAHNPHGKAVAEQKAIDVMQRVGIPDPKRRMSAYPHEFSGGMRQRIAIAMALINDPDVIIADEPTTALDVTTQAQILYEVQMLARDFGTAWIWITHDLSVVAGLAQDIAVMYAGKIVEYGRVDDILDTPKHPYTQGLIASIPGKNTGNKRLFQIPGNTPSLFNMPKGCAFAPRCSYASEICDTAPEPKEVGYKHISRCWKPEQVTPEAIK